VRPADLRAVTPDPEQEAALLAWVVQFEQQAWDRADVACDVEGMFAALDFEDSARRAEQLISTGEW